MIQREDDREIAVLRMAHGKASAMDVALLQELDRQFNDASRDAAAIVVTGTGSIFSGGVDLVRLLAGGPEYARSLLEALDYTITTIFSSPRPVVAAVNGHAIAGGCVIACLADYRLMSAGTGKIGVPELLVGVPFPPLVLEVLRASIPPHALRRLVLTGQTLTPQEALRDGVMDEIVPHDQLVARAVAVARGMASIPRRSFELAKLQLRGPALELAKRAIRENQSHVHAIWSSAETHSVVRRYVEQTLRKH